MMPPSSKVETCHLSTLGRLAVPSVWCNTEIGGKGQKARRKATSHRKDHRNRIRTLDLSLESQREPEQAANVVGVVVLSRPHNQLEKSSAT